eukprot:3911571-Prorocentrum_lima.AAC.1
MAPPCTGLKGFSARNRVVAPDAWRKKQKRLSPTRRPSWGNCPSSSSKWQALDCGEPTKL